MARTGKRRTSADDSPTYPTCVRHLKPRKDVGLRHYFWCDACTKQWVTEAFDGHDPVATGEPLKGYCLLCNQAKTVRLRTWFLCDICDRVARSIGRNHVAEHAILDFWAEQVKPKFPQLVIRQNDVSSLRPRRDTDVSGRGPLDFLVKDASTGKLLFGIENKTGRSSIREMSQFQLDVSDCDSILNHVRELDVPAYIIHAQVLEIWEPPTVGFRVVGLWWTDIYRMAENFIDVKMRRTEGLPTSRRPRSRPSTLLWTRFMTSADALRWSSSSMNKVSPRCMRRTRPHADAKRALATRAITIPHAIRVAGRQRKDAAQVGRDGG